MGIARTREFLPETASANKSVGAAYSDRLPILADTPFVKIMRTINRPAGETWLMYRALAD
jgi:hypothetical protein